MTNNIENVGKKIIKFAKGIRLAEPVLVLMLTFCFVSIAHAQSPSGSLFGSDAQIGNIIREVIKWLRNALFLFGVVAVAWGIFNYITEKSWSKQIIGAIGCFGFGGIVSLIYSLAQGNSVNLDTGF
ncbi:MAG: hypothetical protein JST84_04860 [Acidobacteria bacterium]|nr:hypothetical protein [Acidobacteriota bacterium]